MLSAMDLPPADPLPRPAVDGPSGALNSDAKTRDLVTAEASVLDACEGTRTGVESVSESDADVVSVDSGAKSDTNAGRSASVDVRSDSTPVPGVPEESGAAVTTSAGSGGAAGGSPVGAERSSVPPALAMPDSDSSGEAAALALDSSGRSELDETAEEVQLRLSGSDSPEPTAADEDLLLRDDTEADGPFSPSGGPDGSSQAGGAAPNDPRREGQPTATDDGKVASPTDQSETPAASKPASPSSGGSAVSKPSWPVVASPRSDEAQGSADPVDLPDDMFESAAALNAAEEEEDRERREANQRQAALEAADSLDSLGDSMDVDDARPLQPDVGDDASMDVPDAASPAGDPAPPSDPENSAASSVTGAEVDEDTLDAVDADCAEELLSANGDQPTEQLGEAAGLGDAVDLPHDPEDPDDPSMDPEDSSVDPDDPSVDPDDPSVDPDDPSVDPDDPSVDPDDPSADSDAAAAVSRKRRCSPPTEADASKVRRLESGRPFIAVKKVQLSENNLRLLQESTERDRRRQEETAPGSSAAPAATVNGVKSSLLRRVKLLNRQELETLVLEKMCEAIASRSVIGDMKKSAEKHVTAAERFQKKITYLQKQVGDLHLVVRKLSAELKTRRSPSYPVKITRTVGLQVALAKSVPPLASRPKTAGTPSGTPGDALTGTPASNGVLRAHLSSPPRPRQQFGRSPVPQGQILRTAQVPAATLSDRRGRPPGGTVAAPPPGTAVALLPVVRTTLPLGSVPLAGLTSPRRPAAPAVPGSPGSPLRTTAPVQRQPSYSFVRGRPRVGRPPRQLPAAPAPGGGAADVVDLTDDDDPKRPAARGSAALSPRRPAGVTSVTPVCRPGGGTVGLARLAHPAPFPVTPPNPAVHTGQLLPPPPVLKVTRRSNGIVLSWNMDLTSRHASVVSYHLFAYQEAGPVTLRANPWKKVGDVRALPLPMACTLTQFQEGHKYHFAVRAEDGFRRRGPFSNPSSIALMGAS